MAAAAKKFRVLLRGENFWMMFNETTTRVGFFTTRFLESGTRNSAPWIRGGATQSTAGTSSTTQQTRH